MPQTHGGNYGPTDSEGDRVLERFGHGVTTVTSAQPLVTDGVAGFQPVASVKREDEIRCETVSRRAARPATSRASHRGICLGGRASRAAVKDWSSSALVTGRWSLTLYVPDGTDNAVAIAVAAIAASTRIWVASERRRSLIIQLSRLVILSWRGIAVAILITASTPSTASATSAGRNRLALIG